MIEATSCGGVVIYRGKILALYKSYKNRYEGWVLPKGTVEPGETHIQTALREVQEESGVKAIICFVSRMRSRSWRRLTRNIWNYGVRDSGANSVEIEHNCSDSLHGRCTIGLCF